MQLIKSSEWVVVHCYVIAWVFRVVFSACICSDYDILSGFKIIFPQVR